MKIDALGVRFSELLKQHGTSTDAPEPLAAWSAFKALAQEPVECDEERLFFECDISPNEADAFYLHFARTCYGREPKGHLWSYDVICDFLFPLTEELEIFNVTVEAEELEADAPEREEFFSEVEAQTELWAALKGKTPSKSSVYVGES